MQNTKQSFGNKFRFDKAQDLRLDFYDSDEETSPQIPETGAEEEESPTNRGEILEGNAAIRQTQTPGTSLSGNKFRFGVAMESAKNHAFDYKPAATTRSTGEGINLKGPTTTSSAASRAFKKSKIL